MLPWGERLVIFLAGSLTGATGSYLADKYTDKRRRQEAEKESWSVWERVVRELPRLIAEMRDDVSRPENAARREFFVLRSRSQYIMGRGETLAYMEMEHGDLPQEIAVLENHGYVRDVSQGNARRYRMSEEFVQLLHSEGTRRLLERLGTRGQ